MAFTLFTSFQPLIGNEVVETVLLVVVERLGTVQGNYRAKTVTFLYILMQGGGCGYVLASSRVRHRYQHQGYDGHHFGQARVPPALRSLHRNLFSHTVLFF